MSIWDFLTSSIQPTNVESLPPKSSIIDGGTRFSFQAFSSPLRDLG